MSYEVYDMDTGAIVAVAETELAADRIADWWGAAYDYRPYDEDPTAGFTYPQDGHWGAR